MDDDFVELESVPFVYICKGVTPLRFMPIRGDVPVTISTDEMKALLQQSTKHPLGMVADRDHQTAAIADFMMKHIEVYAHADGESDGILIHRTSDDSADRPPVMSSEFDGPIVIDLPWHMMFAVQCPKIHEDVSVVMGHVVRIAGDKGFTGRVNGRFEARDFTQAYLEIKQNPHQP